MFGRAVVKLTAIYTAILFVVMLGFSATFFAMTSLQLDRPWQPRRPEILRPDTPNDEENVRIMVRQRDDEMRANLLIQLAIIDAGVLALGAVASYFLARRTLRPINEMVQRETRFVSDASHELRTPIAALTMENEVILRDKTATKNDLFRQAKSNLDELYKLSALIDRLLRLSRDEKIPLSEVNIAGVADRATQKLHKIATDKKITIKNQIDARIITANADALEQILIILLDNAIKFSPQKSTVTLGDREGKIFITDEGPGISPDDLPHIFDRFYRAEKSRTSDGYGLGLALAEQLARQMNLKITAENNKGKGATFYIS